MRVLADVDEADVGRLKEKMEADAVVDAFPGESFHGIVQQVRFSPNNQAGVVTYSAVVEVANPEEKLRPGMTATHHDSYARVQSGRAHPQCGASLSSFSATRAGQQAIPQPPDPPLAKGTGRVYVLTNDRPGEEKAEPKIVAIGASDGIMTRSPIPR